MTFPTELQHNIDNSYGKTFFLLQTVFFQSLALSTSAQDYRITLSLRSNEASYELYECKIHSETE